MNNQSNKVIILSVSNAYFILLTVASPFLYGFTSGDNILTSEMELISMENGLVNTTTNILT
jgi:hypothetical protein